MSKTYSPSNLAKAALATFASALALIPAICLPIQAAPPAAAAKPAAATPAPAPAPAAVPDVVMKPGVWETSVSVETIGIAAKRTMSAANCLNSNDLKNTQRFVPSQIDTGLKCDIHDYALKGNTAKWRVTCSGKSGAMVGEGSMKFAADSFAGATVIEPKAKASKASDKTKKIQQTLTGKLQGACK